MDAKPVSQPLIEVTDLSGRIAAQDKATASKVYRAILQSIRDGVLKPGDKLPNERDLSEQFKTSRSTVRHALAMMSAQGLLERKVGSGTFLAESLMQLLSESDLPVAAHTATCRPTPRSSRAGCCSSRP